MDQEKERRFDAALRMAEFAGKRHDGRRAYEWKVTLGLWGVLLLAVINRGKFQLPRWAIVASAVVILVSYAHLWLRGLWRANQEDKRISIRYRGEAEKLLGHEATPTRPDPERGYFAYLGHWSLLFQFITTLLIVLNVAVVLWKSPGAAKTVEAQQFVLRDQEGKKRGGLSAADDGSVALILTGKSGKAGVMVAVDRDESTLIYLVDKEGRPRETLDVKTDGTSSLKFLDKDGKVVWSAP